MGGSLTGSSGTSVDTSWLGGQPQQGRALNFNNILAQSQQAGDALWKQQQGYIGGIENQLRNAEALRSWLATVAGRRSLRWKRGLQRRGEVNLPDEDRDEPENAAPLAPEVMAEVERDQAVREAIANLPARCRELVKLLFLKDPPISYGEAAAHFGLATGSIGFIRGRCIRKLQKALEERGLRPS